MTKGNENRVLETLKHDMNYYQNMIKLYEDISTQRKIPKEIIIPVYEYLCEQDVKGLDTNLLFQICYPLAVDMNIRTLEDLKDWFEQGYVIEVDEEEIRFMQK